MCIRDSPLGKSINLQKLDIPKFNGQYEQWENFRDIFRSLVHDCEDITKIAKFQYLKTHVLNEALEEIKHITLIENNYDKAWKALLDKYENQRRLVSLHLSKFFSIKPMKNESSVELKRVMTDSLAPIESLEAVNRNVKHWDDLLVYIVTERFEVNLRREWEKSLGDSTEPPTFEQLKKFGQTQVMTLESIERSTRGTSTKVSNTSHKSTKNTTLLT